ncbi:3-oxoacyl-ACP synthase [Nonomuraea sp. NN258]|uniref:ketoacyl-ACP synthase III family protein n=1 Tax=Nonomuraea antri TaxID=2730852 RepID=UPI001567FF20|nr:ketoacyl-ACP synthase III family protein [Nonomuraea antri]NRQ31666.1 3-oxoacyl-ACP synthase [Nonomuraea antri]
MRTQGIFMAGLAAYVGEPVGVESAVADGRCPPDRLRGGGLLGVAVADGVPAPEMALTAARQAFAESGLEPGDTGLLLYCDVWHQGPDGWSPHYYLQHHLVGGKGLAVELRQGCNGVLAALQLAGGFLPAEAPGRHALIVAADNFGTPRIDRWRAGPDFLLGDGASAVVLSRDGGFAEVLAVNSLSVPEAEVLHRCGEELFPPSATTGEPVDFDARTKEFVRLCEADEEVAFSWVTVQQRSAAVLAKTLREAGIRGSDVTRTAFTNLSPEAVEHRWMSLLGLPMSRSTWDHARTIGHLGASDHLVALDHLVRSGQVGPGDHVLMGGIGPGITISCAVVKILAARPMAG